MNKGEFSMKKGIKIILIFIMLLGIVFSILNFTLVELNAWPGGNGEMMGAWVYIFGHEECADDGNECNIGEQRN
jgi:hypothetical protein